MGRKGQLSHRFFRYQVIITKFQNLKIIWTPGSNLAFPDILSRNVTIDEYQHHQLQHKKLPRDIQFSMNMDNRLRTKLTTTIPPLKRVTIFIPFIANKAGTRRYSDCIMMVKTSLLTAVVLILPLLQYN